MILSREQIEELALSITNEFKRLFPERRRRHGAGIIEAVPLDKMATEYFGLEITYAPLSADGSICGLTAYADTEYRCEMNGETVILPLKQNQIVLDSRFRQTYQTPSLRARRRFTLAHECAHQILFHLEPDDTREKCRRQYSERKPYSLRELKTREDWNEWQANALGAALLMPENEVERLMRDRYCRNHKIVSHGGSFSRYDRWTITDLCGMMEISWSAAVIRLRELGHMEEYRPESEVGAVAWG